MICEFAFLYALGAIVGAAFTMSVIGASRTRKHPLAASLTAVVCGLLWPVLVVVDVFSRLRP